MIRNIYTFLFLLFPVTALYSQNTLSGKWKTIDDDTGKPKSIVEIYKKADGKYYGKVIKLFREPNEDQDPICDECTDDRKNKKVLGMEIIRGLAKLQSEYKNGTICDPKNGKIYDCKMWIEGDKLQVRGYVLFFFRTQTWERIQ
jgi:uncharacterized protein (DUF2147 family)